MNAVCWNSTVSDSTSKIASTCLDWVRFPFVLLHTTFWCVSFWNSVFYFFLDALENKYSIYLIEGTWQLNELTSNYHTIRSQIMLIRMSVYKQRFSLPSFVSVSFIITILLLAQNSSVSLVGFFSHAHELMDVVAREQSWCFFSQVSSTICKFWIRSHSDL